MRVLHITRDYPPASNGGISTAVGGMVKALRSTGVEVAVLSFDDWRPASGARRARMTEAGPGGDSDLFRVQGPEDLDAARARGGQFRPDLIHVHHGMLWNFAGGLRDTLGVPAIKTVHVVQQRMNSIRGLTKPTLSLAAQNRALAEADAVHVPSEAAWRALAGSLPDAEKLSVLPFGIRPTTAADRSVAARQEGYVGETVLYTGRYDDVKGTDLLPDIWARVSGRFSGRGAGPDLIIAGGLPASPRRERKWRQQLTEGLPAGARARICGWVDGAERDRLMARATLFLCPSRFETFGLAVLEAMLAGVPVVAARAGATSERVRHDETGLLAETASADELADRVVELLEDPDRARSMGLAAAREVRRKDLWKHRVAPFITLYQRLVRG